LGVENQWQPENAMRWVGSRLGMGVVALC